MRRFASLPTARGCAKRLHASYRAIDAHYMLCSEAEVDPRTAGIPTESLLSLLMEQKQFQLSSSLSSGKTPSRDDIRAILAKMGCFKIEKDSIVLRDDKAKILDSYLDMMKRVAAISLGRANSTTVDKIKHILEADFPSFDCTVIGASTIEECLAKFPSVFQVASDGVVTAGSESVSISPEKAGRLIEDVLFEHREKFGFVENWVDIELLLTRYRSLKPLRSLSSEELLEALRTVPSIEMQPRRMMREKLHKRSAHLFIDGDLVAPAEVNEVCKLLSIDEQGTTKSVVRRAGSEQHTSHDIVVPSHVPTYMRLELEAAKLAAGSNVVLKDVVYVCDVYRRSLFEEHVAKVTSFPDANVLVATKEYANCISRSS